MLNHHHQSETIPAVALPTTANLNNGATVDGVHTQQPQEYPARQSTHQTLREGTYVGEPSTKGLGGLGGHEKMTFGKWIRIWGIDLLTMAAMGAVGLGVYEARPAPSRSFPIYFTDGQIVYPQFAYPLRHEIVPIWLAALLAFIVPFLFFAIFQIRRRSFWDLTATTMGLLQSLITAAVFQVFLKWLIGGLRPHFLAVCKPNITPELATSGTGFGGIMFDRSVCTGSDDEINDALESFPSGHSTAAGAGFVYLALYFNAQLKVFADYHPAFWKQIVFFAPLLGACLIAGSLTIDEYHNYYDVLAGLFIGTCTAFASFRMVFAAILDFRFNHLLLPRTESLFFRKVAAGTTTRFSYPLGTTGSTLGSNEKPLRSRFGVDAPFSREAGWAPGVPVEGAPGDALPSTNF
ncbi:Lipid phosphate phosphatase and related enzymes of the PAP2 family [Phaffia rhodozyma]|uniref:Lipid phosphate phosphatase and related enzymes of the PAP2 family n=1 Tax=Phaffia rhodozyma TaxID=264483 RepID=A0A0F7SKI7_PHARH|nr:Lipid phosphate phosphatase and related enzymes of the PAP2 family [Phaffia rhodozyma]